MQTLQTVSKALAPGVTSCRYKSIEPWLKRKDRVLAASAVQKALEVCSTLLQDVKAKDDKDGSEVKHSSGNAVKCNKTRVDAEAPLRSNNRTSLLVLLNFGTSSNIGKPLGPRVSDFSRKNQNPASIG